MRILLILIAIAFSCCSCSRWSLYKTKGTGKMYGVNSRTRQKRDPNSLFIVSEPPKQFSGKLADISQRVLRSKPGTVVTNRGIPHVWRRKETRRDCYVQCQHEQLIACDFYFLFKDDKKCIMMEQDYGRPSIVIKEKKNADTPKANLDSISMSTNNPKLAPTSTDKPKVVPVSTNKPKLAPTPKDNPKPIPIPTDKLNMAPMPTDNQNMAPMPTDNQNMAPMPTDNLNMAPMPTDKLNMAPMPTDKVKVAPTPTNKIKLNPVPKEKFKVNPKPIDQPKVEQTPADKFKMAPMPTNPHNVAPMPENQFVNGAPTPQNSFEENEGIYELKRMIEKVGSRLDASMSSLHSDKQSKEKLMHELQAIEASVQHSISHLSDKVKNLDKVNPQIIERVNKMHNKQEAIVGQVENMASYENEMANALTDIDKKVSELDTDLTAIKETNIKISRQLNGDEMANPEFNRQIISLRRKMMDLTSRVEMNPTMTKMLKNQQVLSEALEAVDRELAVFERRQNRIEENTGDWGGRLIAEEQHRKTINDVLQSVTKAVKDVRKDVTRLQNPMSAENAEKTKEIRQMKSDIKILERSNAKLEQDVFHVRSDLTRLVKDLVNVQLSTYDSKNSIVALVEANKNLHLDYHQQKTNQNQMITQIQTLSSVYRSVLSALHSLELKQIQVMHHLGKYENDVRRVSNDVLGNEKSQILHNMPLISKMRKFQLQLLRQVNHLKRELFKVHRYLKTIPSSSRHQEIRRPHRRRGKLNLSDRMRGLYNTRIGGNGNRVNGNKRKIFNSRFINRNLNLPKMNVRRPVGPPVGAQRFVGPPVGPQRPVGPPVGPQRPPVGPQRPVGPPLGRRVESMVGPPLGPPLGPHTLGKPTNSFQTGNLQDDNAGRRNMFSNFNQLNQIKTPPPFKSNRLKLTGLRNFMNGKNRGQWLSSFNRQLGNKNSLRARPNSFGVRPKYAFMQGKSKRPVLNLNIRNPDHETEEMIDKL